MSHQQLPPNLSRSGARRRRGGWLLPVVIVLLIAVPLAEVWLLLQVGSWIGLLPTLGALVVIAVLGTWLSRRAGNRAWRGLSQALNTGRMPTGELADAALILIGALLLVFPGFFTDIVALVFLLPFARPLAKKLFGLFIAGQAKKYADRGLLPPMDVGNYRPRDSRSPGDGPANPPRSGRDDLIEGEVIDDPDDRA